VTKRSSQCRRYHSYANLKLLNGCRTPAAATATLTGFLGPGLDAGPFIARIDSYQFIWIGSLQPHLCRHAVVQSVSSNRDCWLLTHAPLFMVRFYCTREYLRPLTSSDETSWCWSTLIAVSAWPREQLSTIHIRVPNRGSIRPNTNSPFGPLFGPVRIRIEYSVQPYIFII